MFMEKLSNEFKSHRPDHFNFTVFQPKSLISRRIRAFGELACFPTLFHFGLLALG
jgi:hypothetical protein